MPRLPEGNLLNYLPKLPSPDEVRIPENAMVAVPAEEGGAFKVFTWYEGKWVYTCAFRKDESIIAVLNSAYVYLVKALNGLLRAGANLEDEALLLKLGEVTHGVARAKLELSQGVIVPLEKARDEGEQEGA
jgi:hypothetical protein